MTSNSDAHLCKKIECLKHDLAKDRTRIVSLERRLIVLEESISPRKGNTREEPVSTPDLALADAPPPEYPPDSCDTPQKVSPSIVTKASPDTEFELASEHCPPPYSSRSSDSDDVIAASQPSIRYGLALAPPSLRAQAAHVKKYTIALRKRFAHCVVGGRLVSELYGGGFKKERTRISEERARESGYADFLFLKGFHQPFLPRVPGRVGLFLSASPRQDDWPDFEKVFVNAVPGQREPDDYLYVGEYELLPAGRLTKEEFAALPPDTREYWIRHVRDSRAQWARGLRARVLLREESGKTKEPTKMEVRRMIRSGATDTRVTRIFKDALRDGDELLYVWVMRPVGYDSCFQLNLLTEKRRVEKLTRRAEKRRMEDEDEDESSTVSQAGASGCKKVRLSNI